LDALRGSLRNPKDIHKSISDLLESNSQLEKEVISFRMDQARNFKQRIKEELETINGVQFYGRELDMNNEDVKTIVHELRKEIDDLCIVVGTKSNDKATLTIGISDQLVKSKGLDAGKMVREIAKNINGGGGGQPFFATAGGKNPEGMEKALLDAQSILKTI
jgi:alanyl-tRNA synthetase